MSTLTFDEEYEARCVRLMMVVVGNRVTSRDVAIAVLSNPLRIGDQFYAIDDSDLINTPYDEIRKAVKNKMLYAEPKKFRKEQREWDKNGDNIG